MRARKTNQVAGVVMQVRVDDRAGVAKLEMKRRSGVQR